MNILHKFQIDIPKYWPDTHTHTLINHLAQKVAHHHNHTERIPYSARHDDWMSCLTDVVMILLRRDENLTAHSKKFMT